ncbi:hypothetical protein Tco_0046670 [Tanacetum coccineum]
MPGEMLRCVSSSSKNLTSKLLELKEPRNLAADQSVQNWKTTAMRQRPMSSLNLKACTMDPPGTSCTVTRANVKKTSQRDEMPSKLHPCLVKSLNMWGIDVNGPVPASQGEQEVISSKNRKPSKMTKLRAWNGKDCAKSRPKSKNVKVRVNTEESAVKPEPELKNTIECNLNPSDGPGKPNSITMKTVKTKWALNQLQ